MLWFSLITVPTNLNVRTTICAAHAADGKILFYFYQTVSWLYYLILNLIYLKETVTINAVLVMGRGKDLEQIHKEVLFTMSYILLVIIYFFTFFH